MAHDWSGEQRAIFEWFATGEGNLVVRARAGCAKTSSLIEAINHAPERKILLAAFNKVIAEELQQRLGNPRAEAKTLHGLGYSYVRAAWPKLRVDNRRKWALAKAVVPRGAPDSVLRCVAELHTKAREINPRLVLQDPTTAIEILADMALAFELTLPAEATEGAVTWSDEDVAGWAHDAMKLAMERGDAIDFADMIFLPLVHGWVSPRYDLVCVDEAQDMSASQLELAQRACKSGGRIVVVGDDKQAIYGWRGADSNALDRMKETLEAAELGLKTTYRCPQSVVALAAELVPDFVAAPSAPQGLVRRIGDAKDSLVDGAGPGDFVLSRTNAPLVPACLALLKAGKPARIRGRDITAGLRKQVERAERRGVRDIPGLIAELGEQCGKEIAHLQTRAERGELDPDSVEKAAERASENRAVIVALCEGLCTLPELHGRFDALFSDTDSSSLVMLSTVHRAKGLESERVWLLESTFRSKRRDDAGGWRKGTEEENIRYVAITRSKQELIWLTGEIDS